jgi:sialidase-1
MDSMKKTLFIALLVAPSLLCAGQSDSVVTALGGMRGRVIGPASEAIAKNGEGSTILLRDGAILHAFTRHMRPGDPKQYPNADLWPAVIVRTESKDNGATWSDPTVMFRSSTGDNAMQPGFVRMQNGDLGVSYSQIDSISHATKVFRYSQDEGRTWSPEILISPTDGYWTSAHDRMLLLSTGRILIPLHHKVVVRPERMVTQVAYSDDNGRHWRLDAHQVTTSAMLPAFQRKFGDRASPGFWEASIAELENGKLLMLGRTYGGALYATRSSDDGLTWSDPAPTSLKTGAAPGRLIRIPGSRDLLVVWNSCCVDADLSLLGYRLTLSSAISTDDGLTWAGRRDLESVVPGDGNGVEYPAITIVDGKAFVTYRAETGVGGRYRMEEFLSILPLSWFYAERNWNLIGLGQ